MAETRSEFSKAFILDYISRVDQLEDDIQDSGSSEQQVVTLLPTESETKVDRNVS